MPLKDSTLIWTIFLNEKVDLEMHMHNNHTCATDIYDRYVTHHLKVIEKDNRYNFLRTQFIKII